MLVDRQEDLMRLCEAKGVYRETAVTNLHYLLATGKHTTKFFDFAPGFADTDFCETICKELMQELGKLELDHKVDIILTAALGGISICASLRHFFYGKKPLLFYAEKINGIFALQRNFDLKDSHRVLIFDDVSTSGKSLALLRAICDQRGASVVAQGAVVDRNPYRGLSLSQTITIPEIYLIRHPIHEEFKSEDCPACRDGIPLEKDGILVDNFGNSVESE